MHNLHNQMLDYYDAQISAEATRIQSTFFDITTSLYISCEQTLSQQAYRDLLIGKEHSDATSLTYQALSDELQTMHDINVAISTIRVYTNNPNIATSANIISTSADFDGMDWYRNLSSSNNSMTKWCCTTTARTAQTQENYELTLVRRFALPSTDYSAYMVVTLNGDYLRNRLLYNDQLVMIIVEGSDIFLTSDYNYMKKVFPFPDDFAGEYYYYFGNNTYEGEEYLTSISTLAAYMSYTKFYILVADPAANQSIGAFTRNYVVIVVITLMIPMFLILLFTSYFSSRINAIQKAMHQASLGDYNIIENFHGKDELGQTFEDLLTTINHVREQEARYYEAQLREQQLINKQQQMEFKMLSHQINPHFLYNTLSTIRMQALANEDLTVATSIKLLGKSMHYVLENTGTDATTLDKELEYIEVYLSIQKLRFEDRINYKLVIDEEIETDKLRILPLLLQPIVENAVTHGLELHSHAGFICMEIHPTSKDDLEIEIRDNGEGMDTETYERLLKGLEVPDALNSSNSIGLYNIHQRIKLMYGDKYGLEIYSGLHVGTTVKVVMPQQLI